MGKHRKPTVTRWRPYLTTGIALEAATLFACAHVTDNHVTPNSLLAATTTIFVDGTKSLTGNEQGVSPYRMADSFQGRYDEGVDHDVFVVYPRSLGPATGMNDPTYDVSEGIAATETVKAVKAAQATRQPGDTIYVVGYSQGAGGASQAIAQLEADGQADGVDYTDGVQFVFAADPRRNDGGILTRFPPGVYVPVLGVTFGGGTTPQSTNVLQVTKQYDGVGDAPKYVFNVVADVNAAMGYYYLHPGYYQTVDPSTVPADDRIVSTSADGNITDVLIKAPVGELPLTMPLLQMGVPKNVVAALDPVLRAVIETGYDRPSGPGTYPSEPVPFQLAPPPTTWVSDVQSVADGAAQTSQALTGVTAPAVAPQPQPLLQRAAAVTASSPAEAPDVPAKKPAATPVDSPNKFTPVAHPAGGWKPGDLLRSVLGTFTGAGGSTPGSASAPTSVPAAEPATTPSGPAASTSSDGTSASTS